MTVVGAPSTTVVVVARAPPITLSAAVECPAAAVARAARKCQRFLERRSCAIEYLQLQTELANAITLEAA